MRSRCRRPTPECPRRSGEKCTIIEIHDSKKTGEKFAKLVQERKQV